MPFHTENRDFIAALVVLGLHHPLGAFAEIGPFGDRQHLVLGVEVLQVEYRDALADPGVGVEGGVDVEVRDFGWVLMNSDRRLPCSSATFFQAYCGWFFGSVPISEMLPSPRWLVLHHRAVLGMYEVGAPPRVRGLADVDQADRRRSWSRSRQPCWSCWRRS